MSSIETYFEQIRPDLFGAFWKRQRIEDELRSHLLESVERHQRAGLSLEEAEERAVQGFGSPRDVARAFARSKGVGMPTKFTRWSGLALAVGAIGLSITKTVAEYWWEFSRGSMAEISAVLLPLVALGLVAIYTRARGSIGLPGRIGFRLMVAGLIVGFGSSMAWFTPGAIVGLAILIVGTATYFYGLHRSHDFPEGATILLVISLGLCLLLGGGGLLLDVDTGPIAGAVGAAGFGVGFAWLGLHMWREAESAMANDPPVATA